MSFGSILYQILIGPLELFFEVLYTIAYRVIGNYGLTIIVLSIMMNFLVLPLYRRADEMQEAERDIEAKLHKGITHIKKTFKGDEKMMMLQTYYRQNDYKPTDIIKGSVSLFLEIPFFIAAYRFLSGLECLQGVAFGPIEDLGAPDALLAIAGMHINILPIIMTAVNLVSCVIFTKGFPMKTKVQLYGMAIFFLIFLYTSPAGLVFYWTLNNIFSLIKTIFYKLKNPKKILVIMASVCGLVFLGLGAMRIKESMKQNVFFAGLGIALQLPVLYMALKRKVAWQHKDREYAPSNSLFFVGGLFAAMFVGVLIPSTFIKASPLEYVDVTYFYNPLWYIVSAGCTAVGLFMVWFKVFYSLMNDKGKFLFERALWACDIMFVVNYMFFGKKLGIISPALKYEKGIQFEHTEVIVNSIVVIMVLAIFGLILYYFADKVKGVLYAAVFAVIVMSATNVYGIQNEISEYLEVKKDDSETPLFSFSKNAKNVVFIMLDRAMGEYIPFIMNENPELKKQYEGFTYYSNVISFGSCTNIASPALFGGYEYTPAEINKRSDEPLVEKQNEALKVLPVIFDEHDYDVTVCDPTYANYQWIPDLTIYDEYPDIKTYITNGTFSETSTKEIKVSRNKRNFFCFSIMKSMPVVFQETLYNKGKYNSLNQKKVRVEYDLQERTGIDTAYGLDYQFMYPYNVLKSLPRITSVTETENGSFVFLTNDSTHDIMMLQLPGYTPEMEVDNSVYMDAFRKGLTVDGVTLKVENELSVMHYQCNMAALMALGNWFDYLREIDVFDNTKIILVADHGLALLQNEELVHHEDDVRLEPENYFPLMMVKDFDQKEFRVSDEFMTNADVPTIALSGIVENPVNPFTGNRITNDEKYAHDQYILASSVWDTSINNGNVFLPSPWLSVHDNIWDKNNWSVLQQNSISPFEEITE